MGIQHQFSLIKISLLNSDKIYSTAVHPGSGQTRITITGRVINNASNVVFIAAGKNKSKVVGEIINQKGNYKDYPASFINPIDGELYWLLDEDSASQISRSNERHNYDYNSEIDETKYYIQNV